MKKVFLLLFVSFCFGFTGLVLWAGSGRAQPFPVGLPECQGELDTCNNDLAACEAEAQVFPGDGVVGPPLSYTDHGDGTATDDNTKFMWEVKDNNGGVHDVDNMYSWSESGTDPDGTVFTVFLDILNNRCSADEAVDCTRSGDDDCAVANGGPGGSCGFAGHRDWGIPNVKELQSIVDYGELFPFPTIDPIFPGETASFPGDYWSATNNPPGNPNQPWGGSTSAMGSSSMPLLTTLSTLAQCVTICDWLFEYLII